MAEKMTEPLSSNLLPSFVLRLQEADLEQELPSASLAHLDEISIERVFIDPSTGHRVQCLRTEPREGIEPRGNILLVHDQTNTSAIWEELGTLKVLSAFGYTCVAPDLPAMGQTSGPAAEDSPSRLEFIRSLLAELNWSEATIIGASMAGQYIIPLLNSQLYPSVQNGSTKLRISSIVAIALSDTNQLDPDAANSLTIPVLVLRGELDASLGLSAVENLKTLPGARVVVVQNGRHLCHKSHTDYFHRAVLNFLNVCYLANEAVENKH